MKYSESQALSKIAAYCSKAERAEFDVIKKLRTWELEVTTVNNIIKRLKQENFLNDERYCRAFIKDKSQFNKWGKTKIKFELKKKCIPETIINDCIAELDEDTIESQLRIILTNKIKSIKAENEYERQTKLIRFALGRGFSFEEIKKVLSKISKIDNDDLEFFS